MTKTVSARIENQEHEKLIDLANEEGQTVNEFLNDLISSSIVESNDSDDTDENEEEED